MTDGGAMPRDLDGPRAFAVALDAVVAQPERPVVPKGGRVATTTVTESRTEYDTTLGDLADSGVRLSRTAVDGQPPRWTMRVGADSSEFPADGRAVPAQVRDLLLGVRAGAALRPVRRIHSAQTVYVVCDRHDAERGTVVDVLEDVAHLGTPAAWSDASADGTRAARRKTRSTAAARGSVATVERRRWVEVSGWAGPFADAARQQLEDAGAREMVAAPATVRSIGDALRGFVRDQYSLILRGDVGLRGGLDAVHPTRVAIRRVRSVLRMVPVTDPDRTAVLDADLAWLSSALGAVRDAQVLREHLRASLDAADALTPEVRATTSAALDKALTAEYERTRAELDAVMRGRRYLALLRTLREWRHDPPLTEAAAQPVGRLADHVRAADRALVKKLARAGTSEDRLHRARKAAKRARYVAEFAGAAGGKYAPRVVERATALQKLLGDHQDCVVAADFLARVAATSRGAAAFGCGVIWVDERRRAARTVERAMRRAARQT